MIRVCLRISQSASIQQTIFHHRNIQTTTNLQSTIMEVTRSNFKSTLPLIREALEECDFLAIDAEFTGLDALRSRKNPLDSVSDRYTRLRQGAHQFQIIQYGLCFFTWDSEKETYTAKPFSVYLFPRPYKRFQNDVLFLCQSSSLDFLVSHNFDFNKLFHEGVSYMPVYEEARAKSKMDEQLEKLKTKKTESSEEKTTQPKEAPEIPESEQERMDSIRTRVAEFMLNSELSTLDLDPVTAYQRKLTYGTLEHLYQDRLYLESRFVDGSQKKFVRCTKVTAESVDNHYNQLRTEEIEALDDIVGFTNVLRTIQQTVQQTNKPVIGHNMMLDVMLTVNQFFERLPEDVNDFKASAKESLFGRALDTKLMAESDLIGAAFSSLEGIMDKIKEGALPLPNCVPADGYEPAGDTAYHDAGFDAYCTGYVFLSFAKKLLMPKEDKSTRVELNAEALKEYHGKINLYGMKHHQYMDLTTEETGPSMLERVWSVFSNPFKGN